MSSELDALVARICRLEDERDIQRLIASYGPHVDAADADGAAALWTEDGVYDVEGWRMTRRADVHAMVSSSAHRALVDNGCCHFLGPTVVTVTGDTAVALCDSLVLVRRDQDAAAPPAPTGYLVRQADYAVWRATANHFELARTDGQWRITKRTSRVLNGEPAAHHLLAAGVAGRPVVDPPA